MANTVVESKGTSLEELAAALESLPAGQERELLLSVPSPVSEDILTELRQEFQDNGLTVLSMTQGMDILAIRLVRNASISGAISLWMILLGLVAVGFTAWQIQKTTSNIFSGIPPIAWALGAAGLVYWLVTRNRGKA